MSVLTGDFLFTDEPLPMDSKSNTWHFFSVDRQKSVYVELFA